MIQKILTSLKLPLVFVQGAYFFIKMKKLADPDGSRKGIVGQGQTIKLLVIGDSSALGVGCKKMEETSTGVLVKQLSATYQVNYHICAFTGYTTAQVLAAVKQLPLTPFDYVVISVGSNDIVKGNSLKKWKQHSDALNAYIEKNFNPKKILMSAIPPFQKLPTLPYLMRHYLAERSQSMNYYLIAHSHTNPIYNYLDLDFDFLPEYISEDGFHPSSALYKIQGERLANFITKHTYINQ